MKEKKLEINKMPFFEIESGFRKRKRESKTIDLLILAVLLLVIYNICLWIMFYAFLIQFRAEMNYLINTSNVIVIEKQVEREYKVVTAKVTGYNTVRSQTDDTPCYAGSHYICGRTDVVACPRAIPKGTWVEIDGKKYECLDRTALKYDGRFDISCDKDFACPYHVTGIKQIKLLTN